MALAAAQVVDALAARLAPQALGSGGVKTSRTWPWAESELPACRVFAADEFISPATVDGQLQQHELQVSAQYSARATADLDDALHALAAAGLALLFAGSLPYGLQLTGINRSLGTEGEAAIGQITLQLQCQFFTYPATPETIFS